MKFLRKQKLIVFLSALFLVGFIGWYFVFGFRSNNPGVDFNRGTNAVWLEHKWVNTGVSEDQILKLVKEFQEKQIKYVFVHVGPLEETGLIPSDRFAGARDFLYTARQADKSIVYEAWIGQLRSKIDLSKGWIRQNVADTSYSLIHETGFDGIHLNIEPTFDGDSEFVFLAKEIRERIGTVPLFSVAIGELIPETVTSFLKYFKDEEEQVFGYRLDKPYNTTQFYQNLAKYVDQFAVMAYDTSIKDESLYEWFVEQQVIYVTRAVPNRQIFIGVPTYADVRDNFDPTIENMATGLRGVIRGLNNFRSKKDAFTGVAIYSYWETDEKEWLTYKSLWQK